MTFEVSQERIKEVLWFLKTESNPRFLRLDDLTAMDESARREWGDFDCYNGTVGKETGPVSFPPPNQQAHPAYTMVYHLLSFEPASRLRLKVPLSGKDPVTPTVTDIWPSANWYEREVFDMFGIRFEGHPNLRGCFCPTIGKAILCARIIPAGLRKCLPIPGPRRKDFSLWMPGSWYWNPELRTGDAIKFWPPSPRRPWIDAVCPFSGR